MNLSPMGAALRELSDRGPRWWSIRELAAFGQRSGIRRVASVWTVAVLLALLFGAINVLQGWNGVETSWFGVPLQITFYPPFLVSVLIALWLGPSWSVAPIYLANLVSALVSGLPLSVSLLFALAGVIETLLLWGALVALRVDPDLRRLRDFGWFAAAGVVAAVTGSLAAILWNTSHGLDAGMAQRMGGGWVFGDLLQLLLIAVPILRWAGPPVRGWVDRQFVNPPRREFHATSGVLLTVSAFVVLGLVVFWGVFQAVDALESALGEDATNGELLLERVREIILVMGLLSTALILATGMFATAVARLGERQRREARRDSLTGCGNRNAFPEAFAREAERSRRLGLGLGLLFIDLDHFKQVNDRYGHEVGDLVLARVGRRLASSLRETDLLFRWGGEEFLALMTHIREAELVGLGERVRRVLEEEPLVTLPDGEPLRITASIGGATTSRFPCDPSALLRRADDACYAAKADGRNRTRVAPAS